MSASFFYHSLFTIYYCAATAATPLSSDPTSPWSPLPTSLLCAATAATPLSSDPTIPCATRSCSRHPPLNIPLPLCEEYVVRERARAADRGQQTGATASSLPDWLRLARLCRDEAFASCPLAAARVVAIVAAEHNCKALPEALRLAPKRSIALRTAEIDCAIQQKKWRAAAKPLRTLIVWYAANARGAWAREVGMPKYLAAGGLWPPFTAEERLNMVRALRGTAGNDAKRYDEIRKALASLGDEWERARAEPVLRRLIPFEQAVTDYRAGSLKEAESAFRAFAKAARTPEEADHHRLWLAWTVQKKGDYVAAARLFEQLYARHPRDPKAREHLNRAVGAYKRAGDAPRAAKTLERIAVDYADLPAGAEAGHLAVRALIDAGHYKAARAAAWRFKKRFGHSKRRAEVDWIAAWCTYRLGELKAASRAFLALAGRGGPAEGALYWAAAVREKLRDRRGAELLLRKVATESAVTYYGHLAQSRMAGARKLPPALEPTETSPKEAPRSVATGLIKTLLKSHPLATRDLKRAGAFLDAGLAHEADATLFRLQEQIRFSKGGPKSTAIPRPTHSQRTWMRRVSKTIFLDLNKLHAALGNTNRIAQNLRFSYGYRLTGSTDHRRAAFPTPFLPLVKRASTTHSVPVDLIYAIMHTESSFTPEAVSHANAHGLMQVLPVTARKISERRATQSSPAARDLLDPATSIDYGAWYLRELLTKFKDQAPLAIASYNGGPHNVAAWLDKKGDLSLPEFLEEIPFGETRTYVRKVIAALGIYRRLYSTKNGDVFIPTELDRVYGDNINF